MYRANKCFTRMLTMIGVLFILSQPVGAASLELSIDDTVTMALRNNPVMKIAEADRIQSTWDINQAEADKGVDVSYHYVGQHSDAPPSFEPSLAPVPAWNYFNNTFQATFPIYSGGKLENKLEVAKLSSTAADHNLDAVRQQLRLEVTMDYFNALQAQNLFAVADQSVHDFAIHLQNVQHQYDVGMVAMADVLQTKVKLAKAQDRLIKARNTYDLMVYKLNNVIGLPLRNDTKLKEILTYQPYPLNLDDSIQYALANRPEITQARVKVSMAKDQVKIAQSDQLPTVGLVGTKGWDDLNFPGTKNSNWTIMLTAEMEVFDSGRIESHVKKVEQAVIIAQEMARQTADNIALEVSQAYQNIIEAKKRIETNKVSVDQAELDFSIAQERYEAGMGINLDVIDAELALTESRTDYIQALYDYNISTAQLDKAMGRKVE
jgi:outer membrane protein